MTITKAELHKYFIQDGWTVPQIAEHFGTYPNHIRRLLIRNGFKPSSKGEAQARALKQGRAIHPKTKESQ